MVENDFEREPIPKGYTIIPEEYSKERDELCTPLPIGESPKLSLAKKFTTYFVYHEFGETPYSWQHYFFREVLEGDKDIILCSPRQVGKTKAFVWLSLQLAIYNMKPLADVGYTHIGIASSKEEQQKKIIKQIRDEIAKGDTHIYEQSSGKIVNYFSSRISELKSDSNNTTSITFRELKYDARAKKKRAIGRILGIISTIPATDSARGNTFSILFGDEASFFELDDFFDNVAKPMVRKNNGKMVIASTPNGQRGWFFKTFDPFNELDYNPFKRIWLHYTHIEDDNEYFRILKEKKRLYAIGEEKRFMQESEAMFTADTISFFESDKVDEGIDNSMAKFESFDKQTDMGIDFGYNTANTVITITYKDKEGVSHLLYDKIYPAGKDSSMIVDVQELVKKFKVGRIIYDECPASSFFVQQAKKIGLPLYPMVWRRDKQKKYFLFRQKLYIGRIKYYRHKRLINEMKALMSIEQTHGTMISKPHGGSDDVIDSFLMSVYYQIEDKKGFKVYDWDEI